MARPAGRKSPLLVLLPGLDGTGALFSRFVGALPSTIESRVVPLPARAGAYDVLAEEPRKTLPRDRPFVLLGESFSGPLVLRLAAERPPGLVAVVLVASFHRRPVPGWLAAARRLAPLLLSRRPPAWALRWLLAGEDASPELVAEFRRAAGTAAPGVLAARVGAALDEDATAALEACRVPMLFLVGSRDRLLRPGIARELRSLRADGQIVTLDAPHLVLQRRPLESARAISRFLEAYCDRPRTAPERPASRS